MIPTSERLYDLIVHKRLVHPDDLDLNAHVHAEIAKHSRRGWRSTRPTFLEDRRRRRARDGGRPRLQPEPVELLAWL